MHHHFATKLLRSLGATTHFVDDVLGDLEEIGAQRRRASQPCGRVWYAVEVLRSVPYALREGVRGSALASIVDVTQKALAAWLLLGVVAVIGAGASIVGYDAWSGSASAMQSWVRSPAFVGVLVVALALRCVLLGYLSAWTDAIRPLLTLLTVAAFDALLVYRFVGEGLTGWQRLVAPALVWSLIVLGGVCRVFGRSVEHMRAAPLAAARG